MVTEAVKAGCYETNYGKFPKLQIRTTEDLAAGKPAKLPWLDQSAFKKAAPAERPDAQGKRAQG